MKNLGRLIIPRSVSIQVGFLWNFLLDSNPSDKMPLCKFRVIYHWAPWSKPYQKKNFSSDISCGYQVVGWIPLKDQTLLYVMHISFLLNLLRTFSGSHNMQIHCHLDRLICWRLFMCFFVQITYILTMQQWPWQRWRLLFVQDLWKSNRTFKELSTIVKFFDVQNPSRRTNEKQKSKGQCPDIVPWFLVFVCLRKIKEKEK